MKKNFIALTVLIICLLNLSCIEGAPGTSAKNKFLYSKEDIVGIEIVLVGERQGNGYLDFPKLTTIVNVDDYKNAVEEFSRVPSSNAFDYVYEVGEGEIAVKINYKNSCWQLFARSHTAETSFVKEIMEGYEEFYELYGSDYVEEMYSYFGDYEGLCYISASSSICHAPQEFWAFVTKYVEMYGGDMQVVLENEDYKHFH